MAKKFNYLDSLKQRLDGLEDSERKELLKDMLGANFTENEIRRKQFEIEGMFERYDEIKDRYKNWGKPEGLMTGNWIIDKMTMGLAPGEITVVGGATSNGKTALCINMAADLALKGKQVLFVTLEMTQVELGTRFMRVLGDKFEDAMSNIYFQKYDEMNWTSIDGLIKSAVEDANIDIVFIDHLHYFTRELQNTAEDLGRITKEFKKNAIRHNIPVVLISHTRKSEKSNATKTGINDLRGSSYIAQDADIVLLVYRDKDYEDKIFVTLAKNRNRYGCRVGSDHALNFNETVITAPPFNSKFGK